jgi:hypothetical protein
MSPFRTNPYEFPGRTKIQFTSSARMPTDIYRACLATGIVSNTVYIQHAVIDALVRDLNIPRDTLVGALPPPRGPAHHLYNPSDESMNRYRRARRPITEDNTGGVDRIGPANTNEEVR